MNLADIKKELDIVALDLHKSHNGDGEETDWLRHWEDKRRIAVSIHKDTAYELQADPTINNLGLQLQHKEGEQGPYRAYRIVRFKSEPVMSI